jgi:predicted DNA-binding transcriptional regulator YafY
VASPVVTGSVPRRAAPAAGPDSCVLTTGADSLDAMVMHLGVLPFEFTVLEPAELRERVRVVAARLDRAARDG